MNEPRVARQILRVLFSVGLASSLAHWWDPIVPLEWVLPCGIVGHYLLFTAFSFVIDRKPHWSVLLSALRETTLATIQGSALIYVGLGWIMYAMGGEPNRALRVFAGSFVALLAVVFMLCLCAHTVLHRMLTRQRWFAFTTGQLFVVVLMLSGAVFLNTLDRQQGALFDSVVPPKLYGWPIEFLTVGSDFHELSWKPLLADVAFFAAPVMAFLIFFGGVRHPSAPRALKPRLIALAVCALIVAALSIPWNSGPLADPFRITEYYGWPFDYKRSGEFETTGLLLNLYCYGVWVLIIFAVGRNEYSRALAPVTSEPARHSSPPEPPAQSPA